MEKSAKQKICMGVASMGTVVLLLSGLFGNRPKEPSVSASEVGVTETDEINHAAGSGPLKVTSLKDFGMTEVLQRSGTLKGTINGNKVLLGNSDYATAPDSRYGSGYKGSANSIKSDIPISMEHSWKLDLSVLLGSNFAVGRSGSSCFTVVLTSESGSVYYEMHDSMSVRIIRALKDVFDESKEDTGSRCNIAEPTGSEKNYEISYNSVTKKYTIQYGSSTAVFNNMYPEDKVLKIQLWGDAVYLASTTPPADIGGINRTKVEVTFKSFEYTDSYMKASNYISDYAGRTITGAVGNGNTIKAHPKIANDSAKSQRYSGSFDLDVNNSENLTYQGDIAESPNSIPFSHTTEAFQVMSFSAKVTAGSYEAGQEFNLPLFVRDDYFSKNTDLKMLSEKPDAGAPGTWYNLTKDGKGQLPLDVTIKRATYRVLKSDLNKKDVTGCDYTRNIQPNNRGWYNKDVVLTLQGNEFNELNVSSVNINDKNPDHDSDIDNSSDILSSGTKCSVKGSASSGETGKDGVTYSIFGRIGNSTVTEALSAVSTETFRIDQTAPVIAQTDQNRKDRVLILEDKPAKAGTDAQGNKIEGSGIAYVEWKFVPTNKKDGEIAWPSSDSAWIDSINSDWPSKTDMKRQIIPVASTADISTGSTYKSVTMPSFEKEGSYIFRTADLAGNFSKELKVGNHLPVLHAKNGETTFVNTIKDFSISEFLGGYVDDADEDMKDAVLDWKIERHPDSDYPVEFSTVTGKGNKILKNPLLPGTYQITFSLNGTDSDGNVPKQNEKDPADRNALRVTLKVAAGDPPKAFDKSNHKPMDPEGAVVTKGDGTKHTVVRASHLLIVNPADYYSGGKIIGDELAEEVEKYFEFKSLIPEPLNNITKKVSVIKDGVDFTANGIDTKTEGEYIINYEASDAGGCSVTLQFTYQVRTDLNVTFHAGKGDYVNGAQSKTIKVKYDKKPAADKIPGKKDIKPPVERTFIGWGTSVNAASAVNPADIAVTADANYYAVYTGDMNRDDIPDSEEALFLFQSGDPSHAAYKYSDRTTVGILVPAITPTARVSLDQGQIPELLFDSGYRLKGWKIDNDNKLLTTEQLCRTARGKGSKTTVTAQIEKSPEKISNKVTITFFSSDPKNSPLNGGEGQTITIDAPRPGEPVTIPKSKLPGISLADNTRLEGWKTNNTGDLILTGDAVANQKLYAGSELTCIAYVTTPPEKADNKDKGSENNSGSNEPSEPQKKIVKDTQSENSSASEDTGSSKKSSHKKKISITARNSDGGSPSQNLTRIKDEQVPLSASPGLEKGKERCISHLVMLIWIALSAMTIFFRLHKRRITKEDETTDISDYVFMIGDLIIGAVLFNLGTCSYELPALVGGIILIIFYLIQMKRLDRKEKKKYEPAE